MTPEPAGEQRQWRHRPPCDDPECQPCYNDALDEALYKDGYWRTP